LNLVLRAPSTLQSRTAIGNPQAKLGLTSSAYRSASRSLLSQRNRKPSPAAVNHCKETAIISFTTEVLRSCPSSAVAGQLWHNSRWKLHLISAGNRLTAQSFPWAAAQALAAFPSVAQDPLAGGIQPLVATN